MHTLLRCKVRKGFSLLELLIVILIVSVVYFLGFEQIELGTSKPKPLTPMNLKEQVLKSGHQGGTTTLMCLDECRSCYMRHDLSSSFEAYPHTIDLQNIKSYTVDARNSLVPIEYGRYDDKKICLIMDFYKNRSSTQIILEDKKGAYFLPSFFSTALRFDSPQEAKDHWVDKSDSLSDSGAFY